MSFIANVFRSTASMNTIPMIGRIVCSAAAIEKGYRVYQSILVIAKVQEGRDKSTEKKLTVVEGLLKNVPIADKLAKKILPDSWRSTTSHMDPLMNHLGWASLLVGLASNAIPGTASLGLFFTLYTQPWTHKNTESPLPLLGAFLLGTTMRFKDSLNALIPVIGRITRDYLS